MNGEEDTVAWFTDEILPEILLEGCLPTGKNPRIVNCKFDSTVRFTDHFASSPYFLELTTDSDDGRSVLHLIVKFCSQDDRVVDMLRLERQFRNEINVYSKVLKEYREFLRENPKLPSDWIDQIVPTCYYTRFDANPKKSLLVFADQRKLGYRPAESKIVLDYDHCAIALKELGRFHAVSLAMKIKHPESLKKLRESLTETRYFDDPTVIAELSAFNGICNQRGVDHLLSQTSPKIPKEYVLRLKNMLSQPYDLFRRLITPKEPLALITHGDFCRNNILFRYDARRVAHAKLFDFQATRYANPSLDISFFVYLNTSQQLRDASLNDLLKIYHSSLISAVSVILDRPETEIASLYPFKLIADDFAECAVYGYCLAAFFLAAMECSEELDWSRSMENHAKFLYAAGGERLSDRIADIILDFYKRGFYVS